MFMHLNYTTIEEKKLMLYKIKMRYMQIVLHGRISSMVRRCKILDEFTKHIIKKY